ncbi:hypothetical protein EDEG_03044 [Edhazardia aedis USNM 41457]|uniref:Uncharacterized protein n=1 Tax=Edhazardia aedis (strain USNM 41457) TaxID=1003232 RepID=J9DMD7_EDHAE|nr:hypothetical protein EDEG_03044 [Edhazardia aedis USNM 41457]|eukprot:EJW02532.1 hypothetical protein EDEG_03044 [Edhazardia aedis USNM 41457]
MYERNILKLQKSKFQNFLQNQAININTKTENIKNLTVTKKDESNKESKISIKPQSDYQKIDVFSENETNTPIIQTKNSMKEHQLNKKDIKADQKQKTKAISDEETNKNALNKNVITKNSDYKLTESQKKQDDCEKDTLIPSYKELKEKFHHIDEFYKEVDNSFSSLLIRFENLNNAMKETQKKIEMIGAAKKCDNENDFPVMSLPDIVECSQKMPSEDTKKRNFFKQNGIAYQIFLDNNKTLDKDHLNKLIESSTIRREKLKNYKKKKTQIRSL